MPVDIRKFFGKPDAAKSAASASKGASAKSVVAGAPSNSSRLSSNSASAENDPPPPKKGRAAAASRPPAAKSPPRKKVKRLVIDDDSTDDDEYGKVKVDKDDDDDDVVEVVDKPANARSSNNAAAKSFAAGSKRKADARQRTEISVDEFFADSSRAARAPAASRAADSRPTGASTGPPRKKGRAFDDMEDDDDDEEENCEEEEEEEKDIWSPKKPKKGGKLATPTKPPPAKSATKSPKKKEVVGPLPPSEPYTGKRPLTSEDLRPGCLNGLTFCFSGVLETLSRDASTELVKELGGRVTTAVSGKTDYLVVGPILEDGRPYTDGSKYKKAEQNGRTLVVLGEPLFFGLLLRHDARARALAGEPPRIEANEEEQEAPAEDAADSSLGQAASSTVKPPPSSRDSCASATAKAPPMEAVASSSNASASMPVVNPYAARKIKSNPYATKKAPPPASSNPPPTATNLKSEHGPAGPSATAPLNGMLWVDKHKPLNTKQILGNQDCASKLAGWLRMWEAKFNVPGAVGKSFGGKQGPWKAALLSGPPGIGKTTTAHLVAREAGRDVIEFNASDVRSKSALQEGLGDITGSRTIEFNVSKPGGTSAPKHRTKRCIIMDEVDGMGGGDRGGIASLIQLIKNSHVPIICICNDRQAQKIRSLVDYCMDLRFRRPTKTQLAKRAVEIASREGLLVEPNAAEAIAESCGNDVRQVINALQMWNKSSGRDGSRMTYKQLKDRQHEINKDEILRLGLFDATRTILEGRKGLGNSDPKAERDNFFKRDEAFYVDYNFVGLMVQQNYLRVVQGDFSQTVRNKNDDEGVKVLERMSAAADSMSDFDLASTAIMRSQNWTLLPFSGICAVKTGFHASGPTGSFFPGYPEFTSYLGRNSTKTKKSRLLQEIQYHTNYRVSGGTHELRMTYLPAFRDRFMTLLKGGVESGGSDPVSETIDLMDDYGLDRDDVMEKFDEFSMDPKADTFAKIESKKKAAFTRAYNERAHTSQALVSEQLGAMKKSKRGAGSSSMSETKDPDVIDEDELVEEEDEPGDEDDDDAATQEKIKNLFKPSRKGKSAASSKSGAAKAGAAAKGGRGKAKK